MIAGIPLAFAVGVWLDWHHDNAVLRRQATEITANSTSDAARIHAINDWVYHHKGFGKNGGYFVVPALGPTPVQVLEQGGDCADKSRLVAAMLNELGIEAGLVMIAPCLHCAFIHTVVEAGYEGGGRMVVDPIWNVDYPSDNGRFLGVRDLAWTSLGEERVVELQRQHGAADKIALMPATEAKFDYTAAVNWDKSIFTRAVAEMINVLGYSPNTIFRPRLLEDPKMALFWFLILSTFGLALASAILRRIYNILIVSRHPDGPSSRGGGASPH